MDLQGVVQAVVIAGGTVIVSSVVSVISGASWRLSARRDLELHDDLAAHARCDEEREVAEAMRIRAFERARRGATRKNRVLSALGSAFGFAPATMICLAISGFYILIDPDGFGSPKSILAIMGVAISIDAACHAAQWALDKKAERENSPAEKDVSRERQEEVSIRVDDQESS